MIRLYILVVVFVAGLFSQSALAANATGALCKQHLSMVTQILNREAVGQYWQINDEITNVIGISLNTISQRQSQSPLINGFINVVKSTVSQCRQHCEGVTLSSGQALSCSDMGERNILDLARYGRLIDEASIGSLVTDVVPPVIVADESPTQNNTSTVRPECIGDEDSETCRDNNVAAVSEPAPVAPIPMECLFDQNSEVCSQMINPAPVIAEEPKHRPVSPIITSEI